MRTLLNITHIKKITGHRHKRVTSDFASNILTCLCVTSHSSCQARIKFQTSLSCSALHVLVHLLEWSVTLCPVAFLCFLQYGWWLNTRMRPDQTASTSWTTNSSCTTRQTTLTTGASRATSAGNLTIVCCSDHVVLKCLRGMQIQDCPSLPTTHGVVTSITIWHHRPAQLEMTVSSMKFLHSTDCTHYLWVWPKKRSLSPPPH